MIQSKEVRLLIAVSVTVLLLVSLARAEDCTNTLGYWRNRPGAWPVMHLTLGNVDYSQADLLDILWEPVQGNGLVSLAHQLIAAKLNIAMGANRAVVEDTIESTDQMIGALVVPPIGDGTLRPGSTSVLTARLDAFNNGDIGPGHCDFVNALDARTWGAVKTLYR
jgi:hypothetical protein